MSIARNIFNGTFLQKITSKNLLFIATIVVLLSIYIALRYNCYSTIRSINKLDREITNLRARSVEMKSIYQNTISMHQLSEKLSQRDIGISKEEVKDIIIIK